MPYEIMLNFVNNVKFCHKKHYEELLNYNYDSQSLTGNRWLLTTYCKVMIANIEQVA